MTVNHEIFNTLNNIKTPLGGLSLEPMEEGKGYELEADVAVVRVWGNDNGFASKATLEKAGLQHKAGVR